MTKHRRPLIILACVVGMTLATFAPGAASQDDVASDLPPEVTFQDGGYYFEPSGFEAVEDMLVPILAKAPIAGIGEFDADPLNLVAYAEDTRRYSLANDKIGVYVCTWTGANGDVDLTTVTNVLKTEIRDYYELISGGLYAPTFTARKVLDQSDGVVPNDMFSCGDLAIASNAVAGDNGVIGVMDNTSNGGLGTSGNPCFASCSIGSFPSNGRWTVVGGDALMAPDGIPPTDVPHKVTAVHEIGHALGWPHSYSTLSGSQYDNLIDVMSANDPNFGLGRVDEPYGTIAWNRYRAGWIDPSDVLVYTGGVQKLTLAPAGVAGTQMIAFPTDHPFIFYTLDARRSLFHDEPLPDTHEGVTAHYIDQPCDLTMFCHGLGSDIFTYPPSPFTLDHVAQPGGFTIVDDAHFFGTPIANGTKVKVLSGNDNGYVVQLIGFDDIQGSVFFNDIMWLAEEGITKGCGGAHYCPDNNVTRGQMAAFLVRALDLTDPGTTDFTDDDGHLFEADIEKLAAAGITKGCNPPANTKFCPDSVVTRGAMAAFLVRALNLSDNGGGNLFVDDDGLVFENDIDKLATAGITKGCNPPTNDKFCPTSPVTRGAMAAFLQRALG